MPHVNRNTYNPLLHGDPDVIAQRMVDLLPKSEPLTLEQLAQRERERQEGAARYQELRYGPLPAGMYRLLEQGSFVGWYYELEVDGECITLREPEQPYSEYAVFGDKKRASELARALIAERHGQAAADAATFRVVWGGQL